MPSSVRGPRRSRIGLNRVQWLVRDSGNRLGALVACWRDHLDLVRSLIDLENSYSAPQNIRYIRFNDLEAGSAEYQACPITHNEFNAESEIAVLPCGHYFARQACEEWLRNNDSCPVCRNTARQSSTANMHITVIPIPAGVALENGQIARNDGTIDGSGEGAIDENRRIISSGWRYPRGDADNDPDQ